MYVHTDHLSLKFQVLIIFKNFRGNWRPANIPCWTAAMHWKPCQRHNESKIFTSKCKCLTCCDALYLRVPCISVSSLPGLLSLCWVTQSCSLSYSVLNPRLALSLEPDSMQSASGASSPFYGSTLLTVEDHLI